ncbi:MAG: peptidylprolyl isomerase [Candidatus Glassbacteria bacterium]|nr:peptidylprolyl isomerase [Candidatus Glassbacteria bacterium]
MSRFINLLALTALPAALIFGCSTGGNAQENETIPPPKAKIRQSPESTPGSTELTDESEVAVIQTKLGSIVIRFYPHVAPNHVKNFKSLAESKFFDGSTFHRVIPGFMIQGGDPNSKDDDLKNDGIGSGPRRLTAEFNQIRHTKGIVSAARSQDPNSASSQFFILVAPSYPSLDGQYTVFGKVAKGMDVVDKIVALPRDERDNPGKAALIKSVSIEKAGDVLELPLEEQQ